MGTRRVNGPIEQAAPPGTSRIEGRRLWGVTAFFNPSGSPRRLRNYRIFRRALGVPLVTVELAYKPEFELQLDEAEIMIRLRGRDVLWQKERLLNLALRVLPVECEAVAWLDADVVFERPDWPDLTLVELERSVLVQPFRDVHDCESLPTTEESKARIPTRQSLAFRIASGSHAPEDIATARLANEWKCAAGLAWVARRDLLDRCGLYDAAIVGGGDRAIVCAAYGAWDGLERSHRMNASQLEHYLAWARPFFASVQGRVGYVDGGVVNLTHGSPLGRAYGARHADLGPFGFNPATDIAFDEQGCWRWSSDRPELHEYVKGYFQRRND